MHGIKKVDERVRPQVKTLLDKNSYKFRDEKRLKVKYWFSNWGGDGGDEGMMLALKGVRR